MFHNLRIQHVIDYSGGTTSQWIIIFILKEQISRVLIFDFKIKIFLVSDSEF